MVSVFITGGTGGISSPPTKTSSQAGYLVNVTKTSEYFISLLKCQFGQINYASTKAIVIKLLELLTLTFNNSTVNLITREYILTTMLESMRDCIIKLFILEEFVQAGMTLTGESKSDNGYQKLGEEG